MGYMDLMIRVQNTDIIGNMARQSIADPSRTVENAFDLEDAFA
jgi:hypothetical protein